MIKQKSRWFSTPASLAAQGTLFVDHDPGDEDRRAVLVTHVLDVLDGDDLDRWGTSSLAPPIFMRLLVEIDPRYVRQRGVDFACEECGTWSGNVLRDGWYRCLKCGFPSK